MSGYLPLPGSPDVVEGVAAALHVEAQRIASAHERLLVVRRGAWDSPAGRAFAARVARLPAVLDAVAHRYAGAATALRAFASAFREAQEDCNLAITLRERGAWRRDRSAEAMAAAEASTSPVELARVPVLQQLMAESAAEVLDSERRYLAARQRFDEADQRCRRALAALAEDVLTDSLDYDALKATAALADAIAAHAGFVGLVPVCRPAAAAVGATASGAGMLLRGMVKLGYDEGEWAPIIEEGVLGLVSGGAGALRRGAVARGLPTAAHHGPTGFGSPSARLRAGATAEWAARDPWKINWKVNGQTNGKINERVDAVPPARTVPIEPPGAPSSLHRRAADAVRKQVMRKVEPFRADWGLATRNGPEARAMLLTAWGLDAGTATYTKGKQVNAAREQVVLGWERWESHRRHGDADRQK